MTTIDETKQKHQLRPFAVVIAAALMALNIKILVRNGGLYPGGATGLTILIQSIFEQFCHIEVSYTLINIILNAIPAYIGFRYIGKKFTFYSVVMIILSSVLVDVIPAYTLTSDIFLISIFGGIIQGAAISLCLSVDATSGGTDFISVFLSQKYNKDAFSITLALNVFILGTAGLLFGWDKALYSIIFQYASTQTIHMLYRTYQQITVLIISDRPHDITNMIHDVTRHGATILDGEGAYHDEERKMIYSVINASSEKIVLDKVKEIDPHAFINCIRTREVKGKFNQDPKD